MSLASKRGINNDRNGSSPLLEIQSYLRLSLEEARIKLCMLSLLLEIPTFQCLHSRVVKHHFLTISKKTDVCDQQGTSKTLSWCFKSTTKDYIRAEGDFHREIRI